MCLYRVQMCTTRLRLLLTGEGRALRNELLRRRGAEIATGGRLSGPLAALSLRDIHQPLSGGQPPLPVRGEERPTLRPASRGGPSRRPSLCPPSRTRSAGSSAGRSRAGRRPAPAAGASPRSRAAGPGGSGRGPGAAASSSTYGPRSAPCGRPSCGSSWEPCSAAPSRAEAREAPYFRRMHVTSSKSAAH